MYHTYHFCSVPEVPPFPLNPNGSGRVFTSQQDSIQGSFTLKLQAVLPPAHSNSNPYLSPPPVLVRGPAAGVGGHVAFYIPHHGEAKEGSKQAKATYVKDSQQDVSGMYLYPSLFLSLSIYI